MSEMNCISPANGKLAEVHCSPLVEETQWSEHPTRGELPSD